VLCTIDSDLEKYLGAQLSSCALSTPSTFANPAEVTSLSLADCRLTVVPDKIGLTSLSEKLDSFSGLGELSIATLQAGVSLIAQELLRVRDDPQTAPSNLSQEKELDLRGCNLRVIPDFVMNSKVLTTLDLSNNPLGDSAAKSLQAILENEGNKPNLKSVTLTGTYIGTVTTHAIIQSLVRNF